MARLLSEFSCPFSPLPPLLSSGLDLASPRSPAASPRQTWWAPVSPHPTRLLGLGLLPPTDLPSDWEDTLFSSSLGLQAMLWFPSFPLGSPQAPVQVPICLYRHLSKYWLPQDSASDLLHLLRSHKLTCPVASTSIWFPPSQSCFLQPGLPSGIQTPVSESSLDVVALSRSHCLGRNLPSCPSCLFASIPLPSTGNSNRQLPLRKYLLCAHAVLCQGVSSSGHRHGRPCV